MEFRPLPLTSFSRFFGVQQKKKSVSKKNKKIFICFFAHKCSDLIFLIFSVKLTSQLCSAVGGSPSYVVAFYYAVQPNPHTPPITSVHRFKVESNI